METLEDFHLNLKKCSEELNLFKKLLASKDELDEKKDILPFFRFNLHLSAFIGSYSPYIVKFDKLKHEFSLWGSFRADLVVGDYENANYCFVEFEDAKQGSVFKKKNRTTKEWSPRFEHGYSQVVDWFWKIDDLQKTSTSKNVFGKEINSLTGILILGRKKFLGTSEIDRLRWRLEKNLIDSNKIICITFDQLVEDLESRLDYMLPHH